MLSSGNRRGILPAPWAPISALVLAAGMVGGAVMAFPGSGNYTTVGIRGIRLATVVLQGRTAHVNVQVTERVGANTTVTLSTSGPLSAPASVQIAAGATNVGFDVTAGAVGSDTPASLTASAGGDSETANTTVIVTKVNNIKFGRNPVVAGDTSKSSLLLAAVAPSNTTVTLSSDNPRVHTPASANVAAGNTRSAYFSVTTDGVDTDETATISATVGANTKTATLYVKRAKITTLNVAKSVVGGNGHTFFVQVKLTGRAGPSGRAVAVVSSNTAVVPNQQVVIAPGATSGSARFTTHAVGADTDVTLTAAGIAGHVHVTP